MTMTWARERHRMVIQEGETPDEKGYVATVCMDCGMEDIGRVRR